jgi:hypothetical protein
MQRPRKRLRLRFKKLLIRPKRREASNREAVADEVRN